MFIAALFTVAKKDMETTQVPINRRLAKKDVVSKINSGTSMVAQWLRIYLPIQGTQVRALVWEDPTCCGATRPVSHNY